MCVRTRHTHNHCSRALSFRELRSATENSLSRAFLVVSILRAGDVKKVKFLRGMSENANTHRSVPKTKVSEIRKAGRARGGAGVASVPGVRMVKRVQNPFYRAKLDADRTRDGAAARPAGKVGIIKISDF